MATPPKRPKPVQTVTWLGGTFPAPVTVADDAQSYQPQIAFWLQLPDERVVGLDLGPVSEGPAHLVATLQAALASPRDPRGRTPTAIVVRTEAERVAVAAAVGAGPTVQVGPVAKLQRMVKLLFGALSVERPAAASESYFAGGSISSGAVAALFEAAGALHAAQGAFLGHSWAPFGVASEALAIEQACVVITEKANEAWVFDDSEGFRQFVDSFDLTSTAVVRARGSGRRRSLHLSRAADLPKDMRREALANGWKVSAGAYPRLTVHDLAGKPLPLTEADVRRTAACVLAVAAFARRPKSKKQALVRIDDVALQMDGQSVSVRVVNPHPLLLLPEAPPTVRSVRQPRRATRKRT